MISVDSPSYVSVSKCFDKITIHFTSEQTYHITSTLDSLAVTPLIPGMSPPPITSEPPFVVVGTSDQPFLARIELAFTRSGNSKDQKVVLEHWVEVCFHCLPAMDSMIPFELAGSIKNLCCRSR
jgi:hypothetical protein